MARTHLIVLALVVSGLMSGCGSGPDHVRSQTTSTTTAARSGPPLCGDPVADTKSLDNSLPKEGEPVLVLGPECQVGQVAYDAIFVPGTKGADFAPIHPQGGGDEIIGYWVVDLGWVTPEVAEASGWDADRARAIAPSPYKPRYEPEPTGN